MRVIAGTLKGRKLAELRLAGVRPTSDKLRETLFNVLGAAVEGARVLDGFAGTGAIGIEAISRGAAAVTFVERHPKAAALVGENVGRCGVADRCAIIRAGFIEAARRELRGEAFDIVVIDPPYDDDEADLEAALDAAAALAGGAALGLRAPEEAGLVVLEHAARRPPPDRAGPLARRRTIRSGDSALTFYSR
jgi:16S rRNA (guanine(966)-N(2))-methyltransferase RsmD